MEYKFENAIQLCLGDEVIIRRGDYNSEIKNIPLIVTSFGPGDISTIEVCDPISCDYFTIEIKDIDLYVEDEESLKKLIELKTLSYNFYLEYWKKRDELRIKKLEESTLIIKNLFNYIYPNTSDVQLDVNTKKLNVYVYFPEIEISNTNNLKHKITDFYVKFQFDQNNKLIEFLGARSSVTYDEYSCSYVHSHNYPRKDFYTFKQFCFGSTDFALLDRSLRSEFNENKLKRLLLQLPTYLEWESLEGGPYTKIENIKNQGEANGNSNSISISLLDVDNYYSKLLSNFETLDMSLINNGISIDFKVNEHELAKNLIEVISDKHKCINTFMFILFTKHIVIT